MIQELTRRLPTSSVDKYGFGPIPEELSTRLYYLKTPCRNMPAMNKWAATDLKNVHKISSTLRDSTLNLTPTYQKLPTGCYQTCGKHKLLHHQEPTGTTIDLQQSTRILAEILLKRCGHMVDMTRDLQRPAKTL